MKKINIKCKVLQPYSLGAIAGTINIDLNNNKFPLSNIKVMLINSKITNNKITNTTITNSNGEFIFYEILDGKYTIKILAKGYIFQNHEIIIRDGNIINLEYKLTPLKSNNIIYGKVTNLQENNNAFIGIYKDNKLIATTITNSKGQYVISNIPKGKYKIKAVTK